MDQRIQPNLRIELLPIQPHRSIQKSPVWMFFHKNPDNTQNICNLCGNSQKISSSQTTSALLRHIVRVHPEEVKSLYVGGPDFPVARVIVQELKKKGLIRIEGNPAPIPTKPALISTKKRKIGECDQQNASIPYKDHQARKPGPVSPSDMPISKVVIPRIEDVGTFFSAMPNTKGAICKICNMTVSVRYNGDSNLRRHLRAKHPSESSGLAHRNTKFSSDLVTMSQLSAQGPLKSSQSSAQGPLKSSQLSKGQKKKDLDEKVISFIVSNLLPVSIVEAKRFVELMSLAAPFYYSLPSKDDVCKKLLPKLYQQTTERLRERLERVDQIALTTDTWSLRNNELCLSVNAHFISPTDWTNQSAMLCATVFTEKPSGKDLSLELQRIVSEWHLTEKITVMVTDNETYTYLASEPLPWAYIPCLGHLIHLLIMDALATDKETDALIQKVGDIVTLIQHSHLMTKNLISLQKTLALPDNMLIVNVSTSWNSVYLMFERMCEQMEAVDLVLENNKLVDRRLSDEDKEMMHRILTALKPFVVSVTTLGSGGNNMISMMLPLVKGLLKKMASFPGAKEQLVNKLAEGLTASFGKMEEMEWILAATLIDPRFKNFPFADREAIQKAKDTLIMDVAKIVDPNFTANANDCGDDIDNDRKHVNSNSTSTQKEEVEDSFWEYMDLEMTVENIIEDKREALIPPVARREVQRYLESTSISRTENPLFYWRQHQEMFPYLHKVALKYMSVPIASIPLARFLSNSNNYIVERRPWIKPKHINMILFLNANL